MRKQVRQSRKKLSPALIGLIYIANLLLPSLLTLPRRLKKSKVSKNSKKREMKVQQITSKKNKRLKIKTNPHLIPPKSHKPTILRSSKRTVASQSRMKGLLKMKPSCLSTKMSRKPYLPISKKPLKIKEERRKTAPKLKETSSETPSKINHRTNLGPEKVALKVLGLTGCLLAKVMLILMVNNCLK